MPRRSCVRSGGAAATSSVTRTVRTSMPSSSSISARHVEIHVVAGIVAIEEQDALAAMDRLGRLVDDVGRRARRTPGRRPRRRPCSCRRSRGRCGSWPLPPPISSATLLSGRSVRTIAACLSSLRSAAVIGEHQAVQHLGHDLLGIVQDLLRISQWCPPPSFASGTWSRIMNRITPASKIGNPSTKSAWVKGWHSIANPPRISAVASR